MNNDQTLKLDRARWWLLSNQPFYGALTLSLPDSITPAHGKTACTDGRRIHWHPDFLARLTDEETRFVLAHETLHCAHGHFWRLPPSDGDAQRACDYEINGLLARLPGMKMPAGALMDSQFDTKACEEIFAHLKRGKGKPQDADDAQQDQQAGPPQAGAGQPGEGDGQGEPGQPGQDDKPGQGDATPDPGQCGSFGPPDESADAQPGDDPKIGAQTLKEEWQQRVIQAIQSANSVGRGDCPADLARLLADVRTVRVDWRRELADFVKTAQGQRNDWSRSTRRMATAPVIYPRKRQDQCGLIVAVRDTSGSISDETAAAFTGMIADAAAESGAEVLLLDCDAAIAAEYRIAPGEEFPSKAEGGGGTDFAAPFARARELAEAGEQIAGLIYLTDLDGSGEPDSEDFPTLWICTTDNTAKTGRTVRIDL